MADETIKLRHTAAELDAAADMLTEVYTRNDIDELLAQKISESEGMGLISDAEKQKLSTLENYDDTEIKASLAAQNKYLTPEIITENSDLNDLSSDTLGDSNYRIYYTQTQAVTNTILNKPADWSSGTFTLEVMRMGGSQYMQRLTQQTYNGSAANIYIRTKVHSTTEERWNPWFKVAMTRVDAAVQTASEGDEML